MTKRRRNNRREKRKKIMGEGREKGGEHDRKEW